MTRDRFDAFARALSASGSRRVALTGLLAGTLGLVGLADAESKNQNRRANRRSRRRARRQRRRERRRDQPDDPGASTCSGACGERCGTNNDCYCWVRDDNGQPFCGGPAFDVLDCSQCPLPNTCVDLDVCGVNGGVVCATPCG